MSIDLVMPLWSVNRYDGALILASVRETGVPQGEEKEEV